MSPRTHLKGAAVRKWFLVICAIPIVAVVTLFAYVDFLDELNGCASEDWPTSLGVITTSKVTCCPASGTDGGSLFDYRVSITYRFVVDGKTRTGTRVAYGDFYTTDQRRADRVVALFPKDKQVAVYYKPGNPEECVLIPGADAMARLRPQ